MFSDCDFPLLRVRMSYIVCNQKRKGHKVHVSVCERCMGVQCPDFLNYAQPSLFPSFMAEIRDKRKPFSRQKIEKRDIPACDGPEQTLLFEPCRRNEVES